MELADLLGQNRNIVFVGESGCGKTELALNTAASLARCFPGRVTLIDMDQTKGMYRSRDFDRAMADRGVKLLYGEHFMDAPLVPPGVERLLQDPESVNVLDVGGNEIGAVEIGQYERLLCKDTVCYMVVNPYRALSCDAAHISRMRQGILAFSGIPTVSILLNPHLGPGTTEEIVREGFLKGAALLRELGLDWRAVILPRWLGRSMELPDGSEVCLIERFIQYP